MKLHSHMAWDAPPRRVKAPLAPKMPKFRVVRHTSKTSAGNSMCASEKLPAKRMCLFDERVPLSEGHTPRLCELSSASAWTHRWTFVQLSANGTPGYKRRVYEEAAYVDLPAF